MSKRRKCACAGLLALPFSFSLCGFDVSKSLGEARKGYFKIITNYLNIIPISVCRFRKKGLMSKSVYVRVFHDLELLRYVLRCVIERQL